MSENKFIAKLKGEPTPKSVVEIQNDRLVAPFKSSPMGHIADRDSSVVVAKGAQNWAVNQGQLVPVADDYVGTESDLTATSRVSGAGLWLNATYTFPATGNETNPVSAIIAPSAKWVLTLCGDSLITQNGSVITLTMLVKIGATHLTTKQFKVRECASQFSQRLAIDFSESEQSVIKAHGGSPLTVQVLCDDEGASATIYSGMTHLTLLQRKIDADLVATDNVLLPEFIENLLEGYIIPADYFSRYDYIEQVEDGGKAMPEFTRNGDSMDFTGWFDGDSLKNDLDDLGDQVSGIEEKIPESASAENPLVTRSEISSVYKFKGSVATYNDLPTGATVGDVYNVTDTGANYAWDGSAWDKLSETVDLSSYATTAYVNAREQDIRADMNETDSQLQTQITAQAAEIATKQDQLTAGDNIIISGNVISATGAGGGTGFDVQVVQELPATGQKGIIYLLAKDGAAPDVYDEYVWIETTQTFELIGTTQVDLTGYATKEELNGYLPTTGGSLTGEVFVRDKNPFFFGTDAYGGIIKECGYVSILMTDPNQSGLYLGSVYNGSWDYGCIVTGSGVFPVGPNTRSLGERNYRWEKVCAIFGEFYGLRPSADSTKEIVLPNKTGTMALVEDINAIGGDGTAGQVLTKTDDGFTWQDATGGGDYLPLSGGTVQGVVKIQNGQGTGSLWVGADVNNTTLTNNQRHLARIVVPSYSNVARGATLLGWDSSGDSDLPIANRTADVVGFGGSKKITNATSPMGISFCVTKTRESTAAADKVYPLAMDANAANFDVPVSAPDLTVGTAEGTINIGVVAGTATIATNNGLDIVAQTKFDTAPTTDDTTAWADVNPTALVTKQQVVTAVSESGGTDLPDQTGNAGKFLKTNGTEVSWSDEPIVNLDFGTMD